MQPHELPLWERTLIATYRWRRVRPVPCVSLRKPLPAARVALVTTAGLVLPGQPPFERDRPGGDSTFRVIGGNADLTSVLMYHRSQAFDREAVTADPNVAFPLDRLWELARAGEIGEVAPRHLSFMGSITAPSRLRKEHAPAAAALLMADAVDVALLAPV